MKASIVMIIVGLILAILCALSIGGWEAIKGFFQILGLSSAVVLVAIGIGGIITKWLES